MKQLILASVLLTALFSSSLASACECLYDSDYPENAGLELIKHHYGVGLTDADVLSFNYRPTIMERIAYKLNGGSASSCAGREGDNQAVYHMCMNKRVGTLAVKMPGGCAITLKVVTKKDSTSKAAVLESSCAGIPVDVKCAPGPRGGACVTKYSLKLKN